MPINVLKLWLLAYLYETNQVRSCPNMEKLEKTTPSQQQSLHAPTIRGTRILTAKPFEQQTCLLHV